CFGEELPCARSLGLTKFTAGIPSDDGTVEERKMKHFKQMLTGAIAAAVLVGCSATAMAGNIAIVGGRADDPFFAVVKRGIDDAAKLVEQRGGSVNYLALQTYDNIGADAAQLIRTAISQGVDGIAAPNWVPEAQDEAYKAAKAAGIPILLYN